MSNEIRAERALGGWLIAALVVVLIAVVALDFAIWLQHVMVHAIPLLWRLHRVHHADPDYDLTTGARFHPIEIILARFECECFRPTWLVFALAFTQLPFLRSTSSTTNKQTNRIWKLFKLLAW